MQSLRRAMVPRNLNGAPRALSKLRDCCLHYHPWRSGVTTRHLRPARRLRDARPLAIAQHNGPCTRRPYATAGLPRPGNIAVLGGGLTGLTTAYYLTKFLPEAKITIYEGSGRLGGWIDTETVEVRSATGDKGTVRFERGARTVQPKTSLQNWDDAAFMELMCDLKPENCWLGLKPSNRLIYYPDHLVSLPGGSSGPFGALGTLAHILSSFVTEPLFREGVMPFMWNVLVRDKPAPDMRDISIGEEFLRLGGRREPIDNAISAMCHGIYGGDVWKLSAESCFTSADFMNRRIRKRIRAATKTSAAIKEKWVTVLDQDLRLLSDLVPKNAAVTKVLSLSHEIKSINFVNGFSSLTDAIVAKLKATGNVKFIYERVGKVRLSATDKLEVTTTKTPIKLPLQFDKVISSLFSKSTASLAPPNALSSLASTSAVTIRLVNLWSPVPNLNYRHKGFGYLLPQTISAERNPHAALGVMFDSDRTTVADHALPTNPLFHRIPTGDTVPGTKVTVMLGGHHWSDLPPAFLPDAATSDAAGIQAAKETLRIQMGIDPATWQAAGTKLCVDCIPQHLVGHAKKMEAADWELRQAYGGKLAVVGGSYTAPGVMGAARGARDVAQQVAGGFRTEDGNGEVADSVGDTGLARFVGGTARLWKPAPKGLLEEIRRNRAVIDKTTKAYQEGWAMWDF